MTVLSGFFFSPQKQNIEKKNGCDPKKLFKELGKCRNRYLLFPYEISGDTGMKGSKRERE